MSEMSNLEKLEKEIRDSQNKIILNSYYFYVKVCVDGKKPFMLGSEWFEQIYKKQN